jgi:hypothetical protein
MNIDIESILPNRDFPDYSVFSKNRNSLYFQFALPFLTEYVVNENMVFVCQEHFEELVALDSVLQQEYVEFYGPGNEYYITSRAHDGQNLDIYILARAKQVLMFFTRKAP